ncbi:hypothetical protein BDR04DRAFT_1114526 [Suillus decipiens]|nr:hypothetical protein BDR04DRAFT_1114526 [Suillus decipiens]
MAQMESFELVSILDVIGLKEQNPDQIKCFLQPIVSDLLHLWKFGIRLPTEPCPQGRLVCVILVAVVCDKPAAHEIGGTKTRIHPNHFSKEIVVDPMHNLFLGLVKMHFYNIWAQPKILWPNYELKTFHDMLADSMVKLLSHSYEGPVFQLMWMIIFFVSVSHRSTTEAKMQEKLRVAAAKQAEKIRLAAEKKAKAAE